MQIALIVEMSLAGHQVVGSDLLDFARSAVAGLLDKAPVGHFGHAGHLAVDRPARAVIVWCAVLRPLIDMGEDTEMAMKPGSELARSVYWRTSSRPAGPGFFCNAARQSAENCSRV